MSQGTRVSWDVCRSWRATDQKASDSVSSPSVSRGPVVSRSCVTGIAYQRLLLYPHVEVTSAITLSARASEREPSSAGSSNPLASSHTNRDISSAGRTRGPKTVTPAEKAQAREGSLRRIGRLFIPYRWKLAIVTAIIAASSVVGLASPFLLRAVIDTALPDRN